MLSPCRFDTELVSAISTDEISGFVQHQGLVGECRANELWIGALFGSGHRGLDLLSGLVNIAAIERHERADVGQAHDRGV